MLTYERNDFFSFSENSTNSVKDMQVTKALDLKKQNWWLGVQTSDGFIRIREGERRTILMAGIIVENVLRENV